jgi:hypothetical protein
VRADGVNADPMTMGAQREDGVQYTVYSDPVYSVNTCRLYASPRNLLRNKKRHSDGLNVLLLAGDGISKSELQNSRTIHQSALWTTGAEIPLYRLRAHTHHNNTIYSID